MIISRSTIKKIKEIVKKNYRRLSISLLEDENIMDIAYTHNFINEEGDSTIPTSVEDMRAQQRAPGVKPEGEAHEYAVEHANENTAQLIEKLRMDVSTRLEGLIRESNNKYKADALQNLNRPDSQDELMKESMIGEIKQSLRDATGNANKDWDRIATTEVSNVIGLASTDRIVAKNQDKSMDEVYVFRITQGASACKYCKQFYVDSDGSPKVYRLSTLLSNGSNYGKKTADWKGTVTATHPNEKCSQVIELPPGYMVKPGGSITYIGIDAWNDYIVNKVTV